MKKAINFWSFDNKTAKEAIDLAHNIGYDGIELTLDETGPVNLATTNQELLDLKKHAESTGIKIHSLATGLYWQYSIVSEDKKQRDKAIDIAVKQLEAAKILGADCILFVPGTVGVDFVPDYNETVRYDIAYERALKTLNELKTVAEKHEVYIGVENVWNKFLLSPIEMRNFIEKINSPYVGAYFDVGNVVYSGYPEHWIEILGKHIKKVHFKDYKNAVGGIHGFVDLLAGDVNWKAVMRAFNSIGYDDWVTAEILPPYTHCPDQILYNTFASMERILELC